MRLFISYAHVDKDAVRQIVELLRDGGHDPWFDHDLVVGRNWQEQLREAIDACDAFVYALSPDSVASEWCQWEFVQAVKADKSIIPVLVRKTSLPVVLSEYQYVDFTGGPTAQAAIKLMSGLQAAIRIPRDAVPAAPAQPAGLPSRTPQEDAMSDDKKRVINIKQSVTNSENVTQIGEVKGPLSISYGNVTKIDKSVHARDITGSAIGDGAKVEADQIAGGDINETHGITDLNGLLARLQTWANTQQDPGDREDAADAVKAIKAAIQTADEGGFSKALRQIKRMAPDMFKIAAAALTNPVLGVAEGIRLVAKKMSDEG